VYVSVAVSASELELCGSLYDLSLPTLFATQPANAFHLNVFFVLRIEGTCTGSTATSTACSLHMNILQPQVITRPAWNYVIAFDRSPESDEAPNSEFGHLDPRHTSSKSSCSAA